MKNIARIITIALLMASGIGVIIFALPLLTGRLDLVSIGGFVIISIIGLMLISSGVQIAQGKRIRDAMSDLFRGLGR